MSRKAIENVFSEKQMSPVEAAYLAGFIDGEGIISLHSNGKGRQRWSIVPAVKAAQAGERVLLHLREISGNGRITLEGRTQTAKSVYRWSLTPAQVRHVLPQILPYLFLKRRQAEIVLEFIDLQRGRGISEDNWPHALELVEEVRRLNQRGVRDDVLAGQLEIDQWGREGPCEEADCDRRRYKDSRWCYEHHREKQAPFVRECRYCHESFETRSERKLYCSPKCQTACYAERATAANSRGNGIMPLNPNPGTCTRCGAAFEFVKQSQLYCRPCRIARDKELMAESQARLVAKRRQQAQVAA